jgi:hypothetical protein
LLRTQSKTILKSQCIEPAPDRAKRTSWTKFLKAHWEVIAATNFFTVEVWTARGLASCYVLVVLDLATRSVHIAGMTRAPNNGFMGQVARNLTDAEEGFLQGKAFLIMDRDTKYTESFRGYLDREGIKAVRCRVRAPNCKSAERFVLDKGRMSGSHDSLR